MTFSKLGTDTDTGHIVELPQASRRQGLYIIGANGTGKTGLIENLILQDIDQGLGVGLLDPHGDLTNAILAKMTKRQEDVILLNIGDYHFPFGVNLFACSDPTDLEIVSEASNKVMHIFKKLWGKGGIVVDDAWGVTLEEMLTASTMTFLEYSQYAVYTMAEIPLLLEDAAFRNHLVQKLTFRHVKNYWLNKYNKLSDKDQLEERRSTLNRVRAFLTKPLVENIVGQTKTTVDFRTVMDERKIVLVKLNSRMEDVTSLIGSMIIAEILDAAYSRTSIPVNKRKQFNLYADEFQRFATEDFATLLTEARKFGIATTIAHQARYQPGMTDGIRAVSLQAANLVVFRVTSLDADELAGGFKITPQEAWEEELEEERVEVLKEEWFERVEEEVIDGEEEIKTPVKDVVGHLQRGGTHPDPVVNEFAQGWLRDLDDDFHPWMNTLLYDAMMGKPLPKTYPQSFFYFLFLSAGLDHRIIYNLTDNAYDLQMREFVDPAAYDAFLHYWLTENESDKEQFYSYVKEYIRKHLLDILTNDIRVAHWMISEELVGPGESIPIRATYPSAETLRFFQEQVEEKQRGTWYQIDVYKLDWEIATIPGEETFSRSGDILTYYTVKWVAKSGQEWKCYDPNDLEEEVERQFNEPIDLFEEKVTELKDVMQALVDDPIYAGSGLHQPRKRKQINYHTHPPQTITHPRVAITHPQRTYADIRNEIANQLSSLPNFTARTRITVEGQTVEHTIKTLLPGQGIGKALQQRIADIQARNRNPKSGGYCRPRNEVEAEITKRQLVYSGFPAPQVPQPQPAQRFARQVQVQGKCSNCGFAHNPSGAKFCNQCGTKLK